MTDYLIDGRHGHYGIAAGPMKDVVDNIAKLPEEMVTAMRPISRTAARRRPAATR